MKHELALFVKFPVCIVSWCHSTKMTHTARRLDSAEVGMSFNRSLHSFETAFKCLLYFHTLADNQL